MVFDTAFEISSHIASKEARQQSNDDRHATLTTKGSMYHMHWIEQHMRNEFEFTLCFPMSSNVANRASLVDSYTRWMMTQMQLYKPV